MDYIITSKLTIDTGAKKNMIRYFLLDLFATHKANGNLMTWNLDSEGVLVTSEDNESYSSGD